MSQPAPSLLSRDAFGRAAEFLHRTRPLERVLFTFHFQKTPSSDVLDELAKFQNPDGGFHGLEADIGFSYSSVLSTCHALHILNEVGTAAEHPLVQRTLQYLLATYDQAHGVWPIIPPHDNSQPHAPWWHYSKTSAENWTGLADNPRPDVLACLLNFPSANTSELIAAVIQATLQRIEMAADKMEMHGLLCYLRLDRSAGLPPQLKRKLEQVLPSWIAQNLARLPEKWTGYGLRPLDVAPSSDAPWRSLIPREVEAHLAFLIQTQMSDGSWHPHWNWGGAFPEAWEAGKLKWQAVLTLANLRTLRSYGRIAS